MPVSKSRLTNDVITGEISVIRTNGDTLISQAYNEAKNSKRCMAIIEVLRRNFQTVYVQANNVLLTCSVVTARHYISLNMRDDALRGILALLDISWVSLLYHSDGLFVEQMD